MSIGNKQRSWRAPRARDIAAFGLVWSFACTPTPKSDARTANPRLEQAPAKVASAPPAQARRFARQRQVPSGGDCQSAARSDSVLISEVAYDESSVWFRVKHFGTAEGASSSVRPTLLVRADGNVKPPVTVTGEVTYNGPESWIRVPAGAIPEGEIELTLIAFGMPHTLSVINKPPTSPSSVPSGGNSAAAARTARSCRCCPRTT